MDDVKLELVVTPLHPSLDDEAVRELTSALPTAPVARGANDIILALGTSGALTIALAGFRAWLDRDKARKIAIKIRKDASREIEITSDAANLGELEKLLRDALTR